MDSEREVPAKNRSPRPRNGKSSPRSLTTSERGIRSGADFATFMSALISDIVARRVTPDVGNAACNAGGKLLKVVEMQYKYGTPTVGDSQGSRLLLAPGINGNEV